MLAAQLIQFTDNIGNLHLFAVNGGRYTFFKGHGHILAFLGSFFGSNAENKQMLEIRLVGRIFQFQTFVADVPDVTVTAVAGVCREGKVDSVCLTVLNFGFTGVKCPLVISPCCNDLQIGSKSLDAELETDLVISLTGCTVADGNSAFLTCDLNQLLCDQRSCHGSTE